MFSVQKTYLNKKISNNYFRYVFWFLILNIYPVSYNAAQKYDNIWVRGTGGGPSTPNEYNASFMDFSTKPPSILLGKTHPGLLNCISCISDSLGKLLFFTNLIRVYNAKEEIMTNGNVINFGKTWTDYQDYGYPSFSCAKIIPIQNDSLFLMVYGRLYLTKYLNNSPIQYAIIDPYFENGTGKVLQKDIPFHITNTMNYDFVRHGNGKDWWLILCEWNVNEPTQRYYRYLVNSKGEIDSIGAQSFSLPSFTAGYTRINKQGDIYVKYDSGSLDTNSLSVFNFDRCSGTLKLKSEYQISKISNTTFFEISPNGRYIYLSKGDILTQVDLDSKDNYLFIDTLAYFDGYNENGFGSCFGFTQLTPNNEIMILPLLCNAKAINIIHKPDLPGHSSDFEQHAIVGPNYASEGPQFPNYRLKELSGSPCDTIGFVNINSDWEPDTTNKNLCLIPLISKTFSKLALRIYNQEGDNVLEEQFTKLQSTYCLKTDNLLPGNYLWYMWIDDKKILKGSITLP